MLLKILTPNGQYFEGDVEILNIVSTEGELGILSGHLPLVTMIKVAPMHFKTKEGTYEYAVGNGVLYVGQKETTILTESIESKEEIDINRARSAYDRAKNRVEGHEDGIDMERAQIALQKAITRIRVKGESIGD